MFLFYTTDIQTKFALKPFIFPWPLRTSKKFLYRGKERFNAFSFKNTSIRYANVLSQVSS